MRDTSGSYYGQNHTFNAAVQGLVQDILQTQNESTVGYISAYKIERPPPGWILRVPRSTSVSMESPRVSDPHSHFTLPDALGEYERLVASCIAWGEYSTYVLIGEMGSGKSATLNYLRKQLAGDREHGCNHCTQCQPFTISVDFNSYAGSKNPTLVLDDFRSYLGETISEAVRRAIKAGKLTHPITNAISEGSLTGFDRFARIVEHSTNWDEMPESARCEALFAFMDAAGTPARRLDHLMQLLKFLRTVYRPHAACLFAVYDNIDGLAPDTQYQILVEILRLQTTSNVKAIIAMRYGTFEGLQSNAAYSFGVIHHFGPSPVRILKARLLDWSTNRWAVSHQVAQLRPDFAAALHGRLSHILSRLLTGVDPLQHSSWLAGNSVRNGLFTAERLFINSIVPWNSNQLAWREAARSLIVGATSDARMDPADSVVANILTDSRSGSFTMINIRILQLLDTFRDIPAKRRVFTLIPLLRALGEWEDTDIRSALNSLLNVRRPLIWIDGAAHYESNHQMIDRNDYLYLTKAGYSYLHELLQDPDYFQEAAVALDWELEQDMIVHGHADVPGRFSLLRVLLGKFVERDREEVERLIRKPALIRSSGIRPALVSARVVRSIAERFLRIVKGDGGERLKDFGYREELRNWHSSLLVVQNILIELKQPYSRVATVEGEYRKLIADFPADEPVPITPKA